MCNMLVCCYNGGTRGSNRAMYLAHMGHNGLYQYGRAGQAVFEPMQVVFITIQVVFVVMQAVFVAV